MKKQHQMTHCPPSIVNSTRRGVTLMEVLASIFVLSIGLLGVLAVLPFGNLQVSKANEAEYTSAMLAAAKGDLVASKMITDHWKNLNENGEENGGYAGIMEIPDGSGSDEPLFMTPREAYEAGYLEKNDFQGNEGPYGKNHDADGYFKNDNANNSNSKNKWPNTWQAIVDSHPELQPSPGMKTVQVADCSKFFVVDPLSTAFPGQDDRFYKVNLGDRTDDYKKIMLGQDDLAYTMPSHYRPDFTGQGNNVMSKGQYSWFCTFSAEPNDTFAGNIDQVPLTDLKKPFTVDLLGCFSRVPGDAKECVITTGVVVNGNYLNGVSLALPSGTDLAGTKYLFVSWERNNPPDNEMPIGGTWAKIVTATPAYEGNGVNVLLLPAVEGGFAGRTNTNLQVTLIPGVLYHTTQTVEF